MIEILIKLVHYFDVQWNLP